MPTNEKKKKKIKNISQKRTVFYMYITLLDKKRMR